MFQQKFALSYLSWVWTLLPPRMQLARDQCLICQETLRSVVIKLGEAANDAVTRFAGEETGEDEPSDDRDDSEDQDDENDLANECCGEYDESLVINNLISEISSWHPTPKTLTSCEGK